MHILEEKLLSSYHCEPISHRHVQIDFQNDFSPGIIYLYCSHFAKKGDKFFLMLSFSPLEYSWKEKNASVWHIS